MRRAAAVAALIAAAVPAVALAQADRCRMPDILPRPHLEGPTDDQPKRLLPIGGYTLALTWSPQYCAGKADRRDTLQCGGDNGRFAFTLHGLWPDGRGKDWPQYCKPAALLPAKVVRAHICATPSVQLIQHEWAKHGTCMPLRPAEYFARSRALYGKVRYPDMAVLARRPSLAARDFAAAFAAANPGMRADMLRIAATRDGWLDEVWLCLDRRMAHARCPAHQGGLKPDAPLRIRVPR